MFLPVMSIDPVLLMHIAVTGPSCSFFMWRTSPRDSEIAAKLLSFDPLITVSFECVSSKHSIESVCSL